MMRRGYNVDGKTRRKKNENFKPDDMERRKMNI
jgi:hypothetical protein